MESEVERNLPPAVRRVGLVLTGDKEIKELNRNWRGKDKATDVLSFSQLEGRGNVKSLGPWIEELGDIVISVETARAQARRLGYTVEQELMRLMIHGLLHLLGYDHVGVPRSQAQCMRRLERRLFSQLDENPHRET